MRGLSSGGSAGQFLRPFRCIPVLLPVPAPETLYRLGDNGKRFRGTIQSPGFQFLQSRCFPICQTLEYGGYDLPPGLDAGNIFPLLLQESADMVDVRHEGLFLKFPGKRHQDALFPLIRQRQRIDDGNRIRFRPWFFRLLGRRIFGDRHALQRRIEILQRFTNRIVSAIIDKSRQQVSQFVLAHVHASLGDNPIISRNSFAIFRDSGPALRM